MDVSFNDRDNFIRNMVTISGCGRGSWSPPMRKVETGALPVDVDEILLDLRVDDPDDEEATVERLARGACAFIERRTGFVLLPTVYEITLSDWFAGAALEVLRGPFRQVEAISYQSARDVWTDVDPEDYWVSSGEREFTLRFLDSFTSPPLWQPQDCVRIRFSAGFDAHDESGGMEIEDGLRTVLLMVTGHYYKNREFLGLADQKAGAEAVEVGATSLLGMYRRFW